MELADKIPSMTDAQLASLDANAERIERVAEGRKREAAAELRPLIAAERSARLAALPPKPKRAKSAAAIAKAEAAAAKAEAAELAAAEAAEAAEADA